MKKPVCIIGGGVAGMQVALVLNSLGMPSVLVEKAPILGGRVPKLSRTFPFFNDDGFYDGKEFTDALERDLRAAPLIDVRCGAVVSGLRGNFPNFTVELGDGSSIASCAVVVDTGFTPFNPTSLKEYGYGAYPNVVTATELEWMLNPRGPGALPPRAAAPLYARCRTDTREPSKHPFQMSSNGSDRTASGSPAGNTAAR